MTHTFTVNGRPVDRDVADGTPLIAVLRDDLQLVGVRTGCAIGECGACTVLVDGRPVRSCITSVDEVTGSEVVTPEGLGTPDALHPVQRAFLAHQAAQCGYCVNGMIMTVASLPDGTDREGIRAALDDHLCRCGAHVRVLAAAEAALGGADRTGDGEPRTAAPSSSTVPAWTATTAPAAVEANPRIERWLELDAGGDVVVHAGKVEIGQGVRTAFCQIVAAQVGVPVDRVRVAATRTGEVPDLWFTAGSLSIEDGGTALAHAATAFRRLLLERAATLLEASVDDLDVTADGVEHRDGTATVAFDALAAEGPLTGSIAEDDVPDWGATAIGRPVPRADLVPKLTGTPAYLHDLALPGMLHARVVLPPTPGARLVAVEDAGTRALDGVVDALRDGRLLTVLATDDLTAGRAARRLAEDARWDVERADVRGDVHEHLRALPAEPFEVRRDEGVHEALAGLRRHAATYTTPYQGHGVLAPSVAIARFDDGHLTVWSHTQGIYPLRRELATLLGLDDEAITVEHVDGPGCYGMSGADDAAGFAAVAALAHPGPPIRLQLTIEDEFAWEPYGPAMLVDLTAGLTDDGRIRAWRHHGITDTHMVRPTGAGDRLVASWLREGGVDRPWPGASEGGARNARPLYDIELLDVVADHVRGPLRTAALRCLGAYANIFATESFVDELAELAGTDPVAFRLTHLTDDRARAVLEAAVELAEWEPHVGPSGRGRGVALAHYKGSKAYVAQVADVEVDRDRGDLRVTRIVVVADAGLVVNPDGLRNQLEGGTLQGLSRALFERMTPGPTGVRERDWTSYPVLRFRDVPELEVHVLDRRDHPPLGVGEAATPPVPAAVANAIDDAVGIRLRELPLTGAQMQRRLLEMDEREAARVTL